MKYKFFKLLLILCSIMLCGCESMFYYFDNQENYYYKYDNWQMVEIPTSSRFKAKIKIPDVWKFESEDQIVYLLDENEEVVATQVFQCWHTEVEIDKNTTISNWDKLNFNPNIKLDISNKECYSDKIETDFREDEVYIKKFMTKSKTYYCLFLSIYSYEEFDGSYQLCMIFSEKYKKDTVKKIAESYRWYGNASYR